MAINASDRDDLLVVIKTTETLGEHIRHVNVDNLPEVTQSTRSNLKSDATIQMEGSDVNSGNALYVRFPAAQSVTIPNLSSGSDSVSVLQSTRGNLKSDATIQLEGADVTSLNPLPVEFPSTQDVNVTSNLSSGSDSVEVLQNTRADLVTNSTIQLEGSDVTSLNPLPVEFPSTQDVNVTSNLSSASDTVEVFQDVRGSLVGNMTVQQEGSDVNSGNPLNVSLPSTQEVVAEVNFDGTAVTSGNPLPVTGSFSAGNIQQGGSDVSATNELYVRFDETPNVNVTSNLSSASDSVEVLQNTRADLNANATIQLQGADVTSINPLPVEFPSAQSVTIPNLDQSTDTVEVFQDVRASLVGNMTVQQEGADVNSGNGLYVRFPTTQQVQPMQGGTAIGVANPMYVQGDLSFDGTDVTSGNPLPVTGSFAPGDLTFDGTAVTSGNPLPITGSLTSGDLSFDGADVTAANPLPVTGNIRQGGSDVSATNELYVRFDETPTVNVGTLPDVNIAASQTIAVTQATHDNLNLNANIQFENADVTALNPLPVTGSFSAGNVQQGGSDVSSTNELYVQFNDPQSVSVTSLPDIAIGAGESVIATQSTRASLLTNSTIQLEGADVTSLNPLPVTNSANIRQGGGDVDSGNALYVRFPSAQSVSVSSLPDVTIAAAQSIEVTQTTHDDLNVNANLQFENADVTSGNPLPVTGSFSAGNIQQGGADVSATNELYVRFDETPTINVGTLPDITIGSGETIEVLQASRANLLANATIQLEGADVTSANPLPVEFPAAQNVVVSSALPTGNNVIGQVDIASWPDITIGIGESVIATQTTHDNLNVNATIQLQDADITSGNPLPVEFPSAQDVNVADVTIGTTVRNGQVTVTTSGTRVQFSGSSVPLESGVTIKGLEGNGDDDICYVGDSSVSSSNGIEVKKGELVFIEIDNLNKLYVDADTNGAGISYLGS